MSEQRGTCACPACGKVFRGLGSFTAHRTGPYAPIGAPGTRRCLTALEMTEAGYTVGEDGLWKSAQAHYFNRNGVEK